MFGDRTAVTRLQLLSLGLTKRKYINAKKCGFTIGKPLIKCEHKHFRLYFQQSFIIF